MRISDWSSDVCSSDLAKAAISGPLSDQLAARIAVSSTSRRGTIYNVTTDRYIQSQDNIGIRGQLLWRPTDALDITLTGDWNRQEAVCCGSVFVRPGATQRPLNRPFAALAAAQGYAFANTHPSARPPHLPPAEHHVGK